MSFNLDQDLWKLCKAFLSFPDLCATRSVSRAWMDIRSVPFPHEVYFWDDGSNVNYPDSRDPNFRKCLMAATITKFHCQIFSEEQLNFILQIIPSVKELVFEVDGTDMCENDSFQWNPYLLSAAINVEKVELCISNWKDEWVFKFDFTVLKNLVHIESNVCARYESYDGRPMKCLAISNECWMPEVSDIAPNTERMKIEPKPCVASIHQKKYSEIWRADMNMKPCSVECCRDGLTYYVVRKGTPPTVTARPIFGIDGTRTKAFVSEYTRAFSRIFMLFPNIELVFHRHCDDDNKKVWLKFINAYRKEIGADLLKLENIRVSKEIL